MSACVDPTSKHEIAAARCNLSNCLVCSTESTFCCTKVQPHHLVIARMGPVYRQQATLSTSEPHSPLTPTMCATTLALLCAGRLSAWLTWAGARARVRRPTRRLRRHASAHRCGGGAKCNTCWSVSAVMRLVMMLVQHAWRYDADGRHLRQLSKDATGHLVAA